MEIQSVAREPKPGPLRKFDCFVGIATPFLLFNLVVGIAGAYRYVAENEYLAQGLIRYSLQILLNTLNRDLLFGMVICAGLFVLVMGILRRWPNFRTVILYVYTLQIIYLADRLIHEDRPLAKTVERFGYDFPLPAILHPKSIVWLGIAGLCGILVLWMVTTLFQRTGAKRIVWNPDWLSRRWAGNCKFGFYAVLVIVLIANLTASLLPKPKVRHPYNIIWITWDSTRADHLSTYGYDRPTTPNLERFAKEAVLFEKAIAQHNWTRPSYASMFSSRHAWLLKWPLGLERLTLTEILKDKGYRTYGYAQNPNLSDEYYFDQGFDIYLLRSEYDPPERMSRFALNRIDRHLESGDQPFFLFVHMQEPHWPYRQDNPYNREFSRAKESPVDLERIRELFRTHGKNWDPDSETAQRTIDQIVDLYDASIRYADESVGRIIRRLKEKNLWKNSLVVFNSDHGDELGDRGQFGHGHFNLHPELTYVPLVIHFPEDLGINGGRVPFPVQHVDLMPTLLSILGIRLPQPLSGVSLIPLERIGTKKRISFSSHLKHLALRSFTHGLFFAPEDSTQTEFYDLRNDPDERTPLSGYSENPEYHVLLENSRVFYERSDENDDRMETEDATEISDDLKQRLKTLGYIQ